MLSFFSRGITSIRSFDWKRNRTRVIAAGTVILVVAAFVIMRGTNHTEAPKDIGEKERVVETMRLSELSESVSATFVMKSDTEAAVRAETSGKVARVPVGAGSLIAGGGVLAEIENSAQRAALTQAEGALEAAEAAFKKMRGGTRGEQLAILDASLDSAEGSAVASLLSAYGNVDSAIEDTADQMFSGIEIGSPQFAIPTSNQKRELDIEQKRSLMTATLSRESEASRTISKDSDLKAELLLTENEVRHARTLIDEILAALVDAIPSDVASASDITAFKAAATAARAALAGSLTSLVSARSTLEIAGQNLGQGVAGSESEDIAAAEATVKQVEGAYAAAFSAYRKTIISSPIKGVVRIVNVAVGDYLQPGQEIAIVSVTDGRTAEAQATRVPLTALKMEPKRSLVFTVQEGRLVAVPVELGAVSGESVEVTGALTADMEIVVDARGLKEGDEVTTDDL